MTQRHSTNNSYQSDEVDSAWSTNGCIYYKHKDKSIHEVKYEDFRHWDDLLWPSEKAAKESTVATVDENKKNK